MKKFNMFVAFLAGFFLFVGPCMAADVIDLTGVIVEMGSYNAIAKVLVVGLIGFFGVKKAIALCR